MKRIQFLKNITFSAFALYASPILALENNVWNQKGGLKLSLAQWSLHRQFEAGKLDPNDFASIAIATYGLNAVEYVNGFYKDSANDDTFWIGMKERSDRAGVKNLLIMIDNEGELGSANEKERIQAVENHYKWVDVANILGCHSIRVNAFGDSNKETYRSAMVDGLGRLSDYANEQNINILIENHGLYSSNAKLIVEIIKEVNHSNIGTLPDFGNWCLAAKWGSTKKECTNVYDRYQGVSQLLPYAKGVSAKSYDFNKNGEQDIIDYYKMLKIVKDSGYKGYIGVEYEGDESEHQGILLTKALLEKVWNSFA